MYSIDKLYHAVAQKGNVCVGLDAAIEYLPQAALQNGTNETEAMLDYNKAIVDATLDVAACYKVQIACYEALGVAGLELYSKTVRYIRERGALAIADIKRGDIADTAARYAKAHFSGDFEADFVTLNPYMGMDSLEPWLIEAEKRGKGAFVLLRTSNKGFRDFEGRQLKEGGFVYDAVGEKLNALAAQHAGQCGFGIFGAVVGAEAKSAAECEEAKALRATYGNLFFLIPGYGAQGGGAEEASLLLHADKNGGVVNASRSILTAWRHGADDAHPTLLGAAAAARTAALEMRDALRRQSAGQ
ncbi:MAG: orotidine-5'-phosphate decarboxylase [Spirochaetaceae bacterium]|jgi:orotidine-5'-phosphate decarboxylase|nr:orotidine-5'-phosphate decarboxylase [Spirochaetaceae bacterium]